MADRIDPPPQFSFLVEIDGQAVAGFTAVSGLESEIEVIEYREGNEKQFSYRKLPGRVTYTNIVLKTGVAEKSALYDWHREWVTGAAQQRKQIRIILLDQARKERRAWNVLNAWPAKYVGPTLNALGNEVAIETIELAHEGIDLAN
jgi:phage tail-like protein